MNCTVIIAVLPLLLIHPIAAQQCNRECVQALQKSGAPSFDVQRQCCSSAPTAAPQKLLGDICTYPTGTCKMVQSNPVNSRCICPSPNGPALGLITPDLDQIASGSGKVVQNGRWTSRSPTDCQNAYYEWIIDGDRMLFKDQLGQVDIEHVIEMRPDGYVTETVSSIHPAGKSEEAGTTWNYQRQTNGSFRVERQPSGSSFTLSKCQ